MARPEVELLPILCHFLAVRLIGTIWPWQLYQLV